MARRSLLAFVALTLLAAGCSQSAKEAAKTSSAGFPVGLVFDIGGRGDKSFNDAAYIGLLRAEKELDGTSPAPPERGRTPVLRPSWRSLPCCRPSSASD